MRRKSIAIILILIIFFSMIIIPTKSKASISISKADLYSKGYYEDYLRWGGMGLVFHYVVYKKDGVEYPAYCLNKDVSGVSTENEYSVSIDKLVSDVKVWRAIINGYPYKTYTQLGCKTAEEAYFATKQAVYCMLYDRDPNTYSATDEKGKRTLNALKQIVEAARKSGETKVSSDLIISEENSIWALDEDIKYVSKTFNISSNSTMNTYNIKLENANIEGIKVVDENNIEKQIFNYGEKFKILIPIQNMIDDGEFIVKAYGEVETKPILYGKSSNRNFQDYALVASIYEDGEGSKILAYSSNKTKIIILKQEEESKNPLEGVSFQLLNEEKEIIYTDLVTDNSGIITVENLLPGIYFLKEISTVNGFAINDDLIEIDVALNETVNVTVNNSKEEIIIEQPESEKEMEITVKLPKTGY